jgi:GNAT superfamily N-acetyltransferase
MSEAQVSVRQATPADAEALAALRWQWGHDAPPEAGDPGWERYKEHLVGWMTEHEKTHIAFVAEHGGEAIGMAWLALLPRVPAPDSFTRVGADLQSVYVKPEWRGRGIGIRLVNTVVEEGSGQAKHMTVRTGRSATSFYPQFGFAVEPSSLERALGQ